MNKKDWLLFSVLIFAITLFWYVNNWCDSEADRMFNSRYPYGVTENEYKMTKILDMRGCWAKDVIDRKYKNQLNRNYFYIMVAGLVQDSAPDEYINYEGINKL